MKQTEIDLFVPGRVCLFGEHSDWAGVYRKVNSEIIPGNVIISGTNQGIYATAKAHEGRLIIKSTLEVDGSPVILDIEMNAKKLKKETESDSIFSYAAGVAYYMLEFYGVGGIVIDNYQTNLPVKKGLSSSAAFCVLIARSFNFIYELNLTKRAEIEAAYQGEIMTSSRCGRMDQGCAYGQVPVQMIFDGELMISKPIAPGNDFHLLIGDLKREKNTVKILYDLNKAFPFAETDEEKSVQKFLGEISSKLTSDAIEAIKTGDAELLGSLMTKAQKCFDNHLMEMCEELQSPRLHEILNDPAVRQWSYGGKGVGSQGDGSIQFVTRDIESRNALSSYLTDTYGVECFDLDLMKPSVIKKCIIPVAGNGTRMFPATKAIKKCFLPVVDGDGIAKPIIQIIIEEALSAGVEEIGLIINPNDELVFTSFFTPLEPAAVNKLPIHLQEVARSFNELSKKITYIHQEEQAGLGHAVLCAKQWCNNEPFMLLLGDHIYQSPIEQSCAKQVVDCYEQYGAELSVIGIYDEQIENTQFYGTLGGNWEKENILKLSTIKEKPTKDIVSEFLAVETNGKPSYFCVNGVYIFTPAIYDKLDEQLKDGDLYEGELQLTTAIEALIKDEGVFGYKVDGIHHDTGMPEAYVDTISKLAKK